jgi:hypothetical protein
MEDDGMINPLTSFSLNLYNQMNAGLGNII